ncbi:MAG: hypothetical protein KF688_14585 [Pirellulales bacterium]|nr:hypothetical protein [Pirellulales bacterium]
MSWGTQRPFRVPHWLFCLDVLLHQLGDHLVLVGQLGPQLLDLAVFELFGLAIPRGLLERLVGLIEHLLDPSVNLAGLDAKFIGQVGDRLLPAQMTTHRRGLLLGRKVPALSRHGIFLPWALC